MSEPAILTLHDVQVLLDHLSEIQHALSRTRDFARLTLVDELTDSLQEEYVRVLAREGRKS